MTETEAKREVGANCEDEERIKRIKDKVDAIPIHSSVLKTVVIKFVGR